MEMKTKTPTVYVNMLGGFSITIEDKRIDDRNNQSKKPWSLLEYLITYRKREISSDELIDLIWGDENSANPGGALKTLMFRSRKLLVPLEYPTHELIVQQKGFYAWNPELETIVDIDLFDKLATDIQRAGYEDEKRLEECLKAIALYKGDFLPKTGYESWVVPISTYYHTSYLSVVHAALEILERASDYQRMVEVCQKAITVEKYDEDIHYWMIRALYFGGNQQKALEHYTNTTDMFYNEFAITPSQRFKDLYKQIQDTNHGIEKDINLIQEQMMDQKDNNGAYYCEPTVFKDVCQLYARTLERSGNSVYLCLLTISNTEGELFKPSVQTKAMDELGAAIQDSLRRGDAYTRSSVSQYMILLPTTTYENGEMVLKRILRNFKRQYTRKDMNVHYSLQAFLPG